MDATKQKSKKDKIIELFDAFPDQTFTSGEIKDLAGVTIADVYNTVSDLAKIGFITKPEKGKFRKTKNIPDYVTFIGKEATKATPPPMRKIGDLKTRIKKHLEMVGKKGVTRSDLARAYEIRTSDILPILEELHAVFEEKTGLWYAEHPLKGSVPLTLPEEEEECLYSRIEIRMLVKKPLRAIRGFLDNLLAENEEIEDLIFLAGRCAKEGTDYKQSVKLWR